MSFAIARRISPLFAGLLLAVACLAPARAALGAEGEPHCPGHGPEDPAHFSDINWWQGLIAATDDPAFRKPAQGGKPLTHPSRLFFRYENKKEPCDPSNQPPPFLANILNFALFAGILYKFGRKPVQEALKKRKETIMADIDAATRLREKAEERLEDYETKLERLEETLAALKADYAEQAEIERQRVMAEATEKRARMKRDAEFRVEQELKEARAKLLAEAIDQGVLSAEKLLRDRITQEDAARLADEYLATIGVSAGRAGLGGFEASNQGGPP